MTFAVCISTELVAVACVRARPTKYGGSVLLQLSISHFDGQGDSVKRDISTWTAASNHPFSEHSRIRNRCWEKAPQHGIILLIPLEGTSAPRW